MNLFCSLIVIITDTKITTRFQQLNYITMTIHHPQNHNQVPTT
jgi:hypothetical protein